jgi:hypothetical protein
MSAYQDDAEVSQEASESVAGGFSGLGSAGICFGAKRFYGLFCSVVGDLRSKNVDVFKTFAVISVFRTCGTQFTCVE